MKDLFCQLFPKPCLKTSDCRAVHPEQSLERSDTGNEAWNHFQGTILFQESVVVLHTGIHHVFDDVDVIPASLWRMVGCSCQRVVSTFIRGGFCWLAPKFVAERKVTLLLLCEAECFPPCSGRDWQNKRKHTPLLSTGMVLHYRQLTQHWFGIRNRCVAAVRFIHRLFGRGHWGGMWDQFKPSFIPVTRVEASCLCFSASACDSRSWMTWESSREESQRPSSLLTLCEWTLDFQKRELLNSERSAAGPLRDTAAVWRGPPPRVHLTTPEALLCNRAQFIIWTQMLILHLLTLKLRHSGG